MVQKSKGLKTTSRDKHLTDVIASSTPIKRLSFFTMRASLATLGATIFTASLGAGVYINMHDTAESRKGFNEPASRLASVLKKPAVMQPLPEKPTESVPNISAQQELLVPGDAISIQSVDPIITGPRAYKPRADAGGTASKDS
ncbi:hypothetical protein [Ochrobactrum quorumnocens]|uniref:Uncharacterized protein n=1 Tax=Ochrobactrum quorumnocens TaxID=271865 RepID=A0A248UHN4_9HYPH|nr:hypothetical protein [[Ochrobactrum] quorumnocens]ASV86235.1 hypothetical protein CES85_0989 [[Ochrobactrum] quorumnocens]MBD7993165.1 hypothetical protein [Ochrobactrum gallinarum]